MEREEAIEIVKNTIPYNSSSPRVREALETLIPEFKVSEEEQTRKWILEYLYDGLRKSEEQFKSQFKNAIDWLEKQGELIEKPTKEQVWDYCDKISREWWQITMDRWKSLTDEDRSKYNQFVGFNDFSDMLMNITAGALFQLRDTGKLEYEEGSLLLEKTKDAPKPLEVTNEKQCEQKSKWSEDDEKMIDDIIKVIRPRVECSDHPTIDEWKYHHKRSIMIDWLESLKQQSNWKPTEEQVLYEDLMKIFVKN